MVKTYLGGEVAENHLLMEEDDPGLPVHPATSSTLSGPPSSTLTYGAEINVVSIY